MGYRCHTIFLMLVGAFRMMDPTLEEAARVAKASSRSTFFRVTLPVLLPAILTAGMYSFISSMDWFEAPLAVGLPAGIFLLSTLIYFTTRMQAPINYGLGAAFSVLYMVLMILLLIGYRRAVRYSDCFSTVTGKGYRPRVISLGRGAMPPSAFSSSIFCSRLQRLLRSFYGLRFCRAIAFHQCSF